MTVADTELANQLLTVLRAATGAPALDSGIRVWSAYGRWSRWAFWVAAEELEARRGHPWLVSGPAFAGRLSRLTGTAVRPF